MKRITINNAFRFSVAFAILVFSTSIFAQGQSRVPLLQKIEVAGNNRTTPKPSPTPLVARTVSTSSVRKTSIATLADVDIPGYSGVLIEGLNGGVILDNNSDVPFNPASNVKLATAYAVLKTFGPNFRFPTNVWTDGQVDKSTGTLYGNLYVSGRDPMFNYEHAVSIANELNKLGIRTVTGDLIVTSDFIMSFSSSSSRSASSLQSNLDVSKRSAAANRAWQNYLVNSQNLARANSLASVSVEGGTYVQTVPNTAKLLFTHESAPMHAIVKATLIFSNNFLAERLGNMLGGHYAVARIVQLNANVDPDEFILASSSGLGQNRVTPRAMMKLLRALKEDLARYDMTYADIMPVAGVDRGTLEGRFDSDFARGSVVGKTGTLARTDNGVSTLCGEIQTRKGKFLFVIFNQRGGVIGFRNFQNNFVSLVQGTMGGATPMEYKHIPIDIRLATSRISYPNGRQRVED
jgi:D-alanyl-D-alanine carboxypeptidase/D-alanyl-D-alanine-endopeptidase (penicillin-binding protein 4)